MPGHYSYRRTVLAVVCILLLAGCATEGVNPYPTGDSSLAGRIKACRTGDNRVNTSAECLQDDAACYQLPIGFNRAGSGRALPGRYSLLSDQ